MKEMSSGRENGWSSTETFKIQSELQASQSGGREEAACACSPSFIIRAFIIALTASGLELALWPEETISRKMILITFSLTEVPHELKYRVTPFSSPS